MTAEPAPSINTAPVTAPAVMACRAVTKIYGEGDLAVPVLKGLDLQLAPGTRTAIVGASGSGKSTLLNILGGLDVPTEGDVWIQGQIFSTLSDVDRGRLRNRAIGFVYQFHHLLGEFSAIENVAMPLLIGGMAQKAARAASSRILEQVGLGHRLHHKPGTLSGGERQRVAIARALVTEPACVLMDEPTGNLDGDNARAIQALIQHLCQSRQTAFVIVTHDLALAQQMDAVLLLRDGALIAAKAAP
jgi:lipoprotein-releasing system ATP-binding protein